MLTSIVGLLALALPSIFGLLFKAKAAQASSFFSMAVSLASQVASAVAPHTQNTVDDKIAACLAVLAGTYADHGKTLTDADIAKAKDLFLKLNGVK